MKKLLHASLVLVLALAFAAPVMAQTVDPVTPGTVLSIDELGGKFTLLGEDGVTTYIVTVPAGFVWTDLAVGDTVTVTGVVTDLTIAATAVADDTKAFEGYGTVFSLPPDDFVVVVGGVQYTITPPVGFEFGDLAVGDTVQLTGILTVSGNTIVVTDFAALVEAEHVGTVIAIDEEAGTFTILTADGELVITVPEGFDWTTLAVGDVIIVNGLETEGLFLFSAIDTLFEGDGEGNKGGFYCENLAEFQPRAQRLADEYDVYYEQIMSWFCVDRLGFGEIKNALQASMKLDSEVSASAILALKEELGGWGKVKQELGLVGNDKKSDDTIEEIPVVEQQSLKGKPHNNHANTVRANNGKPKKK